MGTPASREYVVLRERLIAARSESGLTQAEVGRRLGLPQSFVSKYETGERRLDMIELLRVARVLEIDPSQFINQLDADLGEIDEPTDS